MYLMFLLVLLEALYLKLVTFQLPLELSSMVPQ